MCSTDFDCSGNLICHPGDVFWAPADLVNGSFCDCSVLWGYQKSEPDAETCLELGAQSIYTITYTAISLLVCVVALVNGVLTLLGLKRAKKLVWNDTVLTVVLIMLGFLFFLVWKVVLLIEVLEPSEHNQLRSGKQHPLFELELVLISVSYFIILASLSNVAIVWMDVAVRTQRFNIDGSTSFKPRRYVRGYQAFVSIGLLAALLISGNFGFFLAGIITLLGLAGVIAIYAIARRWFSRLLSKVSKSNSQAAQILRRIDILTNIVLVCSIMSSIGFTAFGIFNFFGIAYVCPKGAPCVQIIARDVGTTSGFSTVFGLIPGQESSAYETSRSENELQNSPQMVMRPSNQSNEHMMSPMEEML